MAPEGDAAEARRVAVALTPKLAELTAGLRARGVACGVDSLIVAHRALAEVEPKRRLARAALRAALCSSPRDVKVFDEVFESIFGEQPPAPIDPGKSEGAGEGPARAAPDAEREAAAGGEGDRGQRSHGGAEPDREAEPVRAPARWSATEVLREKSFRAYTASDRRLARAELRRLAATLPQRPSTRWRPAPGRGERLDLRATMRGSLRSGGEPRQLRWRRRRQRQRRLVFVCDVSGSMAPFATMALEYVHAVLRAGSQVEAFCFGTRLTRVTAELAAADPAAALAAAEAKVADRSGGTRIGAAIGELNRVHQHRLGRGAVVVVLSDGWDRGEPGLLGREIGRLRRTAHAVLWLDPHLARPGYEPLTRGMREASPHLRASFAGDSLRGLEALTAAARALM